MGKGMNNTNSLGCKFIILTILNPGNREEKAAAYKKATEKRMIRFLTFWQPPPHHVLIFLCLDVNVSNDHLAPCIVFCIAAALFSCMRGRIYRKTEKVKRVDWGKKRKGTSD